MDYRDCIVVMSFSVFVGAMLSLWLINRYVKNKTWQIILGLIVIVGGFFLFLEGIEFSISTCQ